jgi:hypothetical protein
MLTAQFHSQLKRNANSCDSYVKIEKIETNYINAEGNSRLKDILLYYLIL